MSDYPCQVDGCGRPTHDWTFCSSCSADLERDLAEVAAYRAELETSLARQTALGRREGGRSAETPLSFNYDAAEALYVLRTALVGWVRVAVEEDGARWPADTLDGMAALLLSRLGWLRTHPAGAEAVDEITTAVTLARRTVDRPGDHLFAGVCGSVPLDGPDETCPEVLYARPGAYEVTCRRCSTVHDVEPRRAELLKLAEDQLANAHDLAAGVSNLGAEVTADRIRQWAHRGRLVQRGVERVGDKRTRPLYLVRDVLDLLHGERVRRAS